MLHKNLIFPKKELQSDCGQVQIKNSDEFLHGKYPITSPLTSQKSSMVGFKTQERQKEALHI